MSDQKIIPPGTQINGYEVVSLLAIGGYTDIYKVKDIKTNQLYAMKTELINSEVKTLPLEIECMKQFKEDFFPKFRENGIFEKFNISYLIMDLLGASIDTIQVYHRKKLDMETVYNVCFNMLLIIQAFHSYGYVHRDIKPGNFLIQKNQGCPLVLVDFGISKQHINPNTNKPYPRGEEKYFFGTERYASIDACTGYTQGRKDDLMSWFYSFLDLACGYLPWDDAADFTDMIFIKKFLNISYLNRKFPNAMNDIYNYIRKLGYDDDPNYEYIMRLYIKAMEEDHFNMENFNWRLFYNHHEYLESLTRLICLRKYKKVTLYKEITNESKEESNSHTEKIEEINGQSDKSSHEVIHRSLLKGEKSSNDTKNNDISNTNAKSYSTDEKNNNIINQRKSSSESTDKNNTPIEKDENSEKEQPSQPITNEK